MTREQFEEYVEHFNNKNYEAVTSYFAPDVTVEYFTNLSDQFSPPRTLYGREEFLNSYKLLHEHVREVMELGDFMATEDRVFAELYTEFHCFKDYPKTSFRPLKKGDVVVMTNWVLYNMEDGKMKRIRIAHFRMHDPTLAKF